MREEELSSRQRRVVDSRDAVLLVLGGAGCGKTTAALWAARSELQRSENPASRVAFLTFSRTAVDQIATRSSSALDMLGDRIEVSTFHSMAYRLVRGFGRFVGHGVETPELQSAAQTKLHGTREGYLSYDDLVPLAVKVLQSCTVRELLGRRWPLIICDEFQDTSDEQWELLDLLREQSRLLLLADPNQMIYTFVRGVSAQRLRDARAIADAVVQLEQASHRDPSGAIPALALSVMNRDFASDAVRNAATSGRLRVRADVADDALLDVIRDELQSAWRAGARDYGIFGHSNEGVALLGHELAEAGIDHVLVGMPDAQGEAVVAMASMCHFAVGNADPAAVRLAVATFLTACSRGRKAPALAIALANQRPIPQGLEDRLLALEMALVNASPDPVEVGRIVERSWPTLGILAGNRPWARACLAFGPLLRRAKRRGVLDLDAVRVIERESRAMRSAALLESDRARLPPTKLMNFHQTKGREADAVLLVYRDGDVLAGWRDSEPFEESSRVLYVALTRARRRLTIILPRDAHPLVAPFGALA